MAQAPVTDQLALLKVAELDSRIARLERENTKHPLREKLGVMMNTAAARARSKQDAQTKVGQAQDALAAAEATTSSLQAQIADKESKLNSGVGLTSRDLLVLQSEIESLRMSLDAASDAEFEALEAVEKAEGLVGKFTAQIADLKDQILADRSDLEDAVATIVTEQEELRAQRSVIFDPLAEELKKIYDHSRASGGYAVMGMRPNGMTGAGVTLSPVEVAQIKALPPEQIYLSEDYDAIVVRLPE